MSAQETLRETLDRLRAPVNDEETLISLLTIPLAPLGLTSSSAGDEAVLSIDAKLFLRYIPEYQTVLLQNVLPHWFDHLRDSGKLPIVTMYFMPKLVSGSLPPRHSSIPWNFAVMECIISAHSTLIVEPISQFAVDTLSTICRIHSPLDVFCYIFMNSHDPAARLSSERWTDYLHSLFSVVGRVSNASIDGKLNVPKNLDTRPFLTNMCQSFIALMQNTIYHERDEMHQESASLFLNRLVNTGTFPSHRLSLPSNTSFWELLLPLIRSRVLSSVVENTSLDNSPSPRITFGKRFGPTLFNLPISSQLTIVSSLLSHLDLLDDLSVNSQIGEGQTGRCIVKREALVVREILGGVSDESNPTYVASDRSTSGDYYKMDETPHDDPLWPVLSGVLNRPFTEPVARVVSCGAAVSSRPNFALRILLDRAVDLWCDQDHVRHSTLKKHRAITTLLLTTVAELSTKSHEENPVDRDGSMMRRLSKNSAFISAVGIYIGHADPSIRRCGMLVAEIVAQRTGGKLKFPDWDGEGEDKEWARTMRSLVEGRDSTANLTLLTMAKKETDATPTMTQVDHDKTPSSLRGITVVDDGEDSDDSLEGYASSLDSRSSSPTPSVLSSATAARTKESIKSKAGTMITPTVEEINADPTLLNPSRKKIQKPIYLLDLGKLFKVDKEGDEQCESISMALQSAAALIRKKAGWGLELEENAVDLTYSLIGLQNNYDIEDFDRNVLEALTALVACCPRKVAPCIIEYFFMPSYSTSHRFMMLNALALGARELAGLPTPQITSQKPLFPSKLLPSSQHRRYITSEDELAAATQLRGIVSSITSQAIEAGRTEAEEKVPEIARERQLTVSSAKSRRKGAIVELEAKQRHPKYPNLLAAQKPPTTFAEIAAEYFINPLISQFWNYLNDALAREERALRSSKTGGYRATGTAMILSALVLSHIIDTISILVHASRHSPAFLSVISPAALELAITLGTRRLGADAESTSMDESRRSASVLSASLELAIVILEACIDLDKGRTLASDHGSLLSGVSMWAQKVFSLVESGVSLEGMGGAEEMRLRRASAGLILKLEAISGQWGQAMLMPY